MIRNDAQIDARGLGGSGLTMASILYVSVVSRHYGDERCRRECTSLSRGGSSWSWVFCSTSGHTYGSCGYTCHIFAPSAMTYATHLTAPPTTILERRRRCMLAADLRGCKSTRKCSAPSSCAARPPPNARTRQLQLSATRCHSSLQPLTLRSAFQGDQPMLASVVRRSGL